MCNNVTVRVMFLFVYLFALSSLLIVIATNLFGALSARVYRKPFFFVWITSFSSEWWVLLLLVTLITTSFVDDFGLTVVGSFVYCCLICMWGDCLRVVQWRW